jgi:ectoine hydroxylase-related dioxygenase (phytanoyl-CoA dioxygenase family)
MSELSPAERLKLYGYCLIEDAISAEKADAIAGDCIRLHEKLKGVPNLSTDGGTYETLFGLMNYSELSWECPVHPAVLGVVEELLGKDAQLCEVGSKIVRPGYRGQAVHCDGENAQLGFAVLAHVNTIWMLTDFTVENGATVVAPFSHHARQQPPREITFANKHMVPVIGRKGTLFLWNGSTWHGAGPNASSADVRVGLNASYTAGWFTVRDRNHIKVRPEVYKKMPPRLQEKLRSQQNSSTISELP